MTTPVQTLHMHETRVDQDFGSPYLSAIRVLEVGGISTIVVTDNESDCVKSFYHKNDELCHSRVQLNAKPVGLTKLEENRVMVVEPETRQFETFAVTPDLTYISSITTSKEYLSVVVLSPTRLAAGGSKCVDILNIEGEVIKSVTKHNGRKLFAEPWYMCVSNTGHLLVSDWEQKTVTCLTAEGRVLWISTDAGPGIQFDRPTGITISPSGHIIVADCGLKKVVQLSKSGGFVRHVIFKQRDLVDPLDVCYDQDGSLYISAYWRIMKYTFV